MTVNASSKNENHSQAGSIDAAVWRTHVGRVREINEDRILVRPEIGLFAVSDGMGGHRRGDVAAQAVIDALAEFDGQAGHAGKLQTVCDVLEKASNTLFAQASRDKANGIAGATVAALLLDEAHYSCVWAGDSRAYRLRDDCLTRLTRDHSVSQELIDQNLLDEENRNHHPHASVITRAIGVSPDLELQTTSEKPQPRDRFLLCSDGISALVSDTEISRVLAGSDAEEAADRLVDMVLSRGAPDNLSLVIVTAV